MDNAEAEDQQQEEPSDEELRKLLKPAPSTEQIVDVIRTCYSSVFVTATKKRKNPSTITPSQVLSEDDTPTVADTSMNIRVVKELESYDDKNLWISIEGINYLAKVHNGVESKDLIDHATKQAYEKSAIHLQNAIMIHLNKHGICTNQPQKPCVASTDGNGGTMIQLATPAVVEMLPVLDQHRSPYPLVVRLLGWVPGRPLSSCTMIPIECLADAGRFLGKLDVCLSSLSTEKLQAAKRYHQWDGKNTCDLQNFVQYITDDRKRSMVESVIDCFRTELIDTNVAESSFTKSLIHGDFNDANFLVDDDFCVTGVIDFGDSVESWRILDLSVAMAYALLTCYGKRGRSLSAAAAFLRGYNSVCPITEVERRHLILLIACRLSCSVTLGAYSYQQNPGNEYLLLHSVPAWNALDLIWGTDRVRRASMSNMINKLFDCACSKTGLEDQSSSKSSVINCSDLSFPDPSIEDPMAAARNKES